MSFCLEETASTYLSSTFYTPSYYKLSDTPYSFSLFSLLVLSRLPSFHLIPSFVFYSPLPFYHLFLSHPCSFIPHLTNTLHSPNTLPFHPVPFSFPSSRWKPPPPRMSPEDPHIGWRTEFRSMEVQLTGTVTCFELS